MNWKGTLLWAFAISCLALTAPPTTAAQDTPHGADADANAGADADAGADTDTDADTDADAGADTDADADAGADADAETEAPPQAASDAKRVVRIRKVIELDRERIKWLKGELRERTRWFEDLAESMSEIAAERTELEEKISELEATPDQEGAGEADAKPGPKEPSDQEELDELRAELDELSEDYALLDTQTDLALKAEKTVREQLAALEEKIEKEELALGKLTGEIPIEAPEAAETSPAAQAPQPDASKGETEAVPLPIPGMPKLPPADEPPESSSEMTAAQLQAQKELEGREREVSLAKQELAEFIERKRALQRQIEFEKSLQESDTKERENLERALEVMTARLEKYREEQVPSEKIQRRERANRRIESVLKEAQRSGDARTKYIESLAGRLADLEEAQLRITGEVDEAQDAADKARRHVMWLESPIHPQNVWHWATERGPRMLLVVFAAIALLAFVHLSARRVARAVVRRRRGSRSEGTGRADTLAFSFRSASRVLIVVFAVLLVLQEAGVDIKTVLGGAAIIGVAIAFGAQDLMKDYFSGFLILLEDQYQLGDLVTIGGVTGTVESVNMRVTVLRDLEGRVHFIPNGNINAVTNRTYAWGRPVFEIPVRFDEDVDRVMETLVEIAKELSEDPDWKGSIIGDPEMLGVDKFTEYGVVIKFMVKTQPDKLFPVRREMLRRISKRFNELGIQLTVPQRLIVRDGPEGGEL